ncbi:Ig-like domain-containing protein, partial [Desulforamulus aeronauticus]
NVNTGAKTLVNGFNTSAFICQTTSGGIRSTMAQLNCNPKITISLPATNQSFSTAPGRKTITISGTVSDVDNNNVTISAAINGKTKITVISNTSTAKTWSLTWDVSADNIAEGSYSNILVTADDGMGGIATATMGYTLTVDRTTPVISISGVANGQTYQNSVTPIFSATDAGGAGLASVTATLNGMAYTSGTAITSAGGQVLVVTAIDHAGNQSQQSVNFTVNKAPTCLLFSPATNQTLAEGQVIVVTENRFTVRITPDDANTGDALQYKIIQSGITKVDWKNCSRSIAFDCTFTDVLLGNNVCQVMVRDDRGGQVTRTFTVRNKASGSAVAALSQKGVREVLIALGYPGTAFRCLNDLKPSGYTGPLSFSGIINSLS